MAVVNANALVINAINAESGTQVPFANAQSASISFSNSLIDVTTKTSNTWKESISGQRSFTVSADGLIDFETTSDETNAVTLALWAGIGASAAAAQEVYFSFGIGSMTYDGSGWISSLEQSGGTDDAPTYSVSIEGNGELVYSAT